jgi:hypothetical protein
MLNKGPNPAAFSVPEPRLGLKERWGSSIDLLPLPPPPSSMMLLLPPVAASMLLLLLLLLRSVA